MSYIIYSLPFLSPIFLLFSHCETTILRSSDIHLNILIADLPCLGTHQLSRMASNTATHAAAEAAKLSNPSNPRVGNLWIRFSAITQFELMCSERILTNQTTPLLLSMGIHGSFTDWAHSALGACWGRVMKETCLQGYKFQVPLSKHTIDYTALSQLLP